MLQSVLFFVHRRHAKQVQRVADVLSHRHDAHIESRASKQEKFVLDCTHCTFSIHVLHGSSCHLF